MHVGQFGRMHGCRSECLHVWQMVARWDCVSADRSFCRPVRHGWTASMTVVYQVCIERVCTVVVCGLYSYQKGMTARVRAPMYGL